MSAGVERAILVLGPSESTNLATIGRMLHSFGAIDMRMVERQEKAGIRRYEDIAKDIRDHEGLRFGTPKHRDVKIKEPGNEKVDLAIYVVPANEEYSTSDAAATQKLIQDAASSARGLIILVEFRSKDEVWPESQFRTCIENLGINPNDIPTIPTSDERFENFGSWDRSPKSAWYGGWKKGDKAGQGLLEALDALL